MIGRAVGKAAGALRGDGLTGRAGRGTILTMIDFGGSNVLRLGSNLILTRLLFPEAFGLMALVQVVTGGIRIFSDVGLNASIIRHERGDEPDFINTVWTMQVIRGVILWLAVVLVSPFASDFYGEPILASLLIVTSFGAVIEGFGPTRTATANRHLVLGRVTVLSIGNQAVNIVVTALLAWWLQSVWALAYGALIGAAIRNMTTRMFIPGIRNRFRFERDAARDIFHFGKYVMLGTIAGFVVQNADRALLGKFLSVDVLGVYVIALTLASVPLMMVRRLTWRIVFPLYSRRPPHQSAGNRRNLSRARFGLTGVVFLAAAALIFLGDPLIRVLYPAIYHSAGPVAELIALGLLPVLIVTNYLPVLLANNESGRHALINSFHAVARAVALYVGIRHFGVIGAALAPLISTAIYYPVLVLAMRRWRAWDPLHDAVFAALALVLAGLAWWLNGGLPQIDFGG